MNVPYTRSRMIALISDPREAFPHAKIQGNVRKWYQVPDKYFRV